MSTQPGTVYLVGAGPGDRRLVTLRAGELVRSADVILYDRLTPSSIIATAKPDAELVYVGKSPDGHRHTLGQHEINELMVKYARAGRSVVRLKGGDPFVFGRGGEEALALARANIRFEVVPGVTAGVAAPAYAGIPVTHRDAASAVAFVTGHEDPGKDEAALDWNALATFPGTLVLYMGVRNLARIAQELIAAGRPSDEPAAVVEWGTTARQRLIRGTLAEIAERARAADVSPPALTVIGPVAKLHDELAWFDRAPLFGRKIAITRARAQASELAQRLADLGAEVLEVPAIRVVPRVGDPEVARALDRFADYTIVCLTSPNAVKILFDALGGSGQDARALAGKTVAAIGPGTARALAEHGVSADLVPQQSTAESLVDELAKLDLEGARALVARAAVARELLPDALCRLGAAVDVVALYDTVAERLSDEQREQLTEADYVTFTSSSTVTFLLDALGSSDNFPQAARVVSIGPVTSATASERGLKVDVEAVRHDIDGLVEALIGDAQRRDLREVSPDRQQ